MYASAHETILVVVQVLALLVLVYVFHAAYQARLARKHELSKRMLDKLSSEELLTEEARAYEWVHQVTRHL